MDFEVVQHRGIESWIKKFAGRNRITGSICFDFIGDADTLTGDAFEGRLFCIECNPRVHSAIMSYHGHVRFETAFRYC